MYTHTHTKRYTTNIYIHTYTLHIRTSGASGKTPPPPSRSPSQPAAHVSALLRWCLVSKISIRATSDGTQLFSGVVDMSVPLARSRVIPDGLVRG